MTTKTSVLAALACLASAAAGCAEAARPEPVHTPRHTLPAFQSEEELGAWLQRRAKERRTKVDQFNATGMEYAPIWEDSEEGAPASVPAAEAPPPATGFSALVPPEEESVTNVQHAGVDEGGIVKVHGDYLVMLRRGRLFTVAIGDGALRPVSAVDAFGPDVDPAGAWYDELLVADGAVVVIGYSYDRGGTEVGLFRIDGAGRLEHRSTYHLRSNDYYSSRNYASRLVDGKLVFYTPTYLALRGEDPFAEFPAVRRWRQGAEPGEFRRMLPATRVYRAGREMRAEEDLALHTVTVCDLAAQEMACEGTAVMGPPGRVFYVSPGAVYVWTSGWRRDETGPRVPGMLYRIPLDGSGPSALAVTGSPVDQFSFLESGDGHLNVLVRSAADGDGMWHAEAAEGDVALLRVPLDSFGGGEAAAPAQAYRPLPVPGGHTFQNRFVGDYLLYGTGSGWGDAARGGATLYAVPWREGSATALALPHGVDRIEAMGGDAVVVGTDGGNLHFSAVRLAERPSLAQRYIRAAATQGELRSHGFFYKPEGRDSGILGLPVRGADNPGHAHLREGSASILFLRNQPSRFEELGELASLAEDARDDGCRASCVDWYGNARPLFLRGRIFALLGYEIVEGSLADGRMREMRRVNYAPASPVAGR